jgi:hypothetical protein
MSGSEGVVAFRSPCRFAYPHTTHRTKKYWREIKGKISVVESEALPDKSRSAKRPAHGWKTTAKSTSESAVGNP